MDELINTKQLCNWLGISENTAYNWRKNQKLPFIKLTKKTIKYDKKEIIKWLQDNGREVKVD
jgi:predicted DNA-binding transcriptional regulator AlpA